MKAVVVREFGNETVMKVEEIPVRDPGANEVRVQVHAAGLNPNEIYVLTGTYGFFVPELPFTPGFDAAGIVDAVGADVAGVQKGDRVYVGALTALPQNGSYAETMVVDAAYVHPLPERLSFSQGAALGIPADAAYRALFDIGRLQAGETVLIHGASGGVGQFAVQMAKAAGAKVIGTASSEEGCSLIKELGADHAIQHLTPDDLSALRDATDQKGPDLIIEFLANVNLAADLDAVAKNGRIVVVGNRGEITINPRRLMEKECSIHGMAVTHITPEDRTRVSHAIFELLETGKVQPRIGKEYTFDEVQQAHRDLMDRKAAGKLILRIRD